MVQYLCSRNRSASVALVVAVFLTNVITSAQTTPNIKIVVVEGQGAINNMQQRRAKEPIVQVTDANNAPVEGATVTFVLPDTGPSGDFPSSGHMLTLQTDAKGQAIGRGLRPNTAPGRFQIRVTASYHGETVTAAITQINAQPAGASAKSNSKTILIIALIGGGAAAGLAAALGGKSSSGSSNPSTPPTTPTGTILVPGTPVLKGP
jgi:hypothetical protein